MALIVAIGERGDKLLRLQADNAALREKQYANAEAISRLGLLSAAKAARIAELESAFDLLAVALNAEIGRLNSVVSEKERELAEAEQRIEQMADRWKGAYEMIEMVEGDARLLSK